MRILAVDPGGNTGLAHIFPDEDESFKAWILPHGDDQDWLANNVQWYDLVVCESFNITQQTLLKSQAGSKLALYTIGVVGFLCRTNGVPLKMQEPAVARSFDEDWSKLKTLGWYTPGPDHARSAARHLLVAALEYGVVEPEQLVTR